MGDRGRYRWWFVAAAAIALGVAGLYQFAWSSIRGPLGVRLSATETGLGTVFTLFVITQTLAQFPAGRLRDRRGPRLPLAAAGILLAVGYVGMAIAPTLPVAYLFYAIGGVGSGFAYTVAINTPVKWFTDRRGLATGVVGMAYGGLSFLVIPGVRRGVDANFEVTLFALGGLAAAGAFIAAVTLRDPERPVESTDHQSSASANDDGDAETETIDQPDPDSRVTYTWREAVRTWQFWLLYAAFVIVNGVGLMIIEKVVTFAGTLGLPPAAATGSASLVAVADAGGVVLVGGASDRFGAVRTAGTAMVLCGIALALAVAAGAQGFAAGFVALIGVAAFFRSPPFVIFPGIVGRYYGTARSSENYAVLYTSKLWGGVVGGTATSLLVVAIGWSPSFLLGAGLIALAGVAIFFLRPP